MAKKTKKAAIILMIIILISKITGFLRDIILAQTFGVSEVTDAYLTALNIPVVLFNGISAAVGTTFIPIFFNIKEKYGEHEVNKFTSNLINIVTIISIIFITFGIIFAPYIVKIFAIGFKGEVLNLTLNYLKILLFSMIFIAINGIISSYLVAQGNVYISGVISIPFNIFVIGSIIVGSITNSYIMVIGTLIAYIFQLLFQVPYLIKQGYNHSFKIDIKDKNIRQIIYLAVPVFFGSYVSQINTIVNRTLASTLTKGSITALNYANKLSMFAVGVIVISLTTIMYPILSKLASEENLSAFKYNLSKSINIIIIVMIPITVIMMDFSVEIVKVLFEEGSFDTQATYLTSTALFYLCLGILAFGLREILAKAFYSLQDTKTPVKNATTSIIINVALSIILVRYMGLEGLALANSISAVITTILLFISLRRKIGKIGFRNIATTFIKILISSIIIGIIIRVIYNNILIYGIDVFDEGRKLIFIAILISCIIGLIIYIFIAVLFNVKEVKEFIILIKGKLNKISTLKK